MLREGVLFENGLALKTVRPMGPCPDYPRGSLPPAVSVLRMGW
jgi:hypothetical protein